MSGWIFPSEKETLQKLSDLARDHSPVSCVKYMRSIDKDSTESCNRFVVRLLQGFWGGFQGTPPIELQWEDLHPRLKGSIHFTVWMLQFFDLDSEVVPVFDADQCWVSSRFLGKTTDELVEMFSDEPVLQFAVLRMYSLLFFSNRIEQEGCLLQQQGHQEIQRRNST